MSLTKERVWERWKGRSRLALNVDRRDFGGPREFYSGEKRGVTGERSLRPGQNKLAEFGPES